MAPTVSAIDSPIAVPFSDSVPATSTLAENSAVGAVNFKLPVPVSAIYECEPS